MQPYRNNDILDRIYRNHAINTPTLSKILTAISGSGFKRQNQRQSQPLEERLTFITRSKGVEQLSRVFWGHHVIESTESDSHTETSQYYRAVMVPNCVVSNATPEVVIYECKSPVARDFMSMWAAIHGAHIETCLHHISINVANYTIDGTATPSLSAFLTVSGLERIPVDWHEHTFNPGGKEDSVFVSEGVELIYSKQ